MDPDFPDIDISDFNGFFGSDIPDIAWHTPFLDVPGPGTAQPSLSNIAGQNRVPSDGDYQSVSNLMSSHPEFSTHRKFHQTISTRGHLPPLTVKGVVSQKSSAPATNTLGKPPTEPSRPWPAASNPNPPLTRPKGQKRASQSKPADVERRQKRKATGTNCTYSACIRCRIYHVKVSVPSVPVMLKLI